MTLQKIPVRDLRVGMFLARFDGAWLDHAAWRCKYRIASAEHLAAALGSGAEWCWIDPGAGPDGDQDAAAPQATLHAADEPALPVRKPAAHDRTESLAQDLRLANRLRKQARASVTAVFEDARLGKVPNIEATRPVVAAIVDSVLRRKGALLCLAHLKFKDDYTYMHSMSVCAMAAAVAQELGMEAARCHSVGLAALMHDIGKARVPLAVLNKPGKLTAQEWAVVRKHPQLGQALLLEGRFMDADVLDACGHHHEKLDGSGYPHGLQGDAISPLARIVAVCDVFDAMTSARPYKPAWDPAQAVMEMAGWCGHFDRHVLAAFIRVVGVFPVGSLVRLVSQRLAVVVANVSADPRAPLVRVFYSTRSHEPLPLQLIDLAAPGVGDAIAALEPRERWNFPQLEALCDLPLLNCTMPKVLVVDDSALMRRLLTQLLTEAGFQVGVARNGAEGVQQLTEWQPDVVTLDINMPEMDGLTALSLMMQARPTPVVMVSSLTEQGAQATFEALALGAVDFIAKPGGTISLSVEEIADTLIQKVKAASRARLRVQRAGALLRRAPPAPPPPTLPNRVPAAAGGWDRRSQATPQALGKLGGVVVVGVSTGGPRTLEDILPGLPPDFAWPVLVAQHMPGNFTDAFARRMDALCRIRVRECNGTLPLEPGHAYIGRGGTDMVVVERLGRLAIQPRPETPGHPWHPSVDVLVDSAMKLLPAEQIVGVLLTGMGNDGARAMAQLKARGGRTIAESQETAVVFGMPQELIELGGASLVLPCGEVTRQLCHWVQNKNT